MAESRLCHDDSTLFVGRAEPQTAAWIGGGIDVQLTCPAPAAKVLAAPPVEGKTSDETVFKVSSLKGKVVTVMVMFWSTGCAVCRDKMPALRNHHEGWSGKPFEWLVISTDAREQALLNDERIIARTVPLKQRLVQLWPGESGDKDNRGPHAQPLAAYLLDTSGKVVEGYTGRSPADARDRMADRLLKSPCRV